MTAKCAICGFELPSNWPTWNELGDKLCIPCQHVKENIGINRTGLMTPWEHK